MKKIKRLLCMMLAVLLLALSCAAAASAEEPAGPNMAELHQKFIAYLNENNIQHIFPGELGEEESSRITFITETEGWVVFYGTPGWLFPTEVSDQIGNYILVNSSWENPYKLGIYVEKNGKILTLNDANNAGEIILDDTIIELIIKQIPAITVYSSGDTDMDGVVAVQDVLNVQKVIAKMKATPEEFMFVFYDYNNDNNINVYDTLDMQKKIAKISVKTS